MRKALKNKNRTAKRRRTGRTSAGELRQLSANAERLGRTAKRLYATARLSTPRACHAALTKIAAFFGYSLSKTARLCLQLAEAMEDGKRGRYNELLKNPLQRIRTGKRIRRPRNKTRADLWAADSTRKPSECNRNNYRLTAYELAIIDRKQAENIAKGHKKTFSRAFVMAQAYGSIPLKNMMSDYLTGQLLGIDPEEARLTRPTRAKAAKTPKEEAAETTAKRTKAGL